MTVAQDADGGQYVGQFATLGVREIVAFEGATDLTDQFGNVVSGAQHALCLVAVDEVGHILDCILAMGVLAVRPDPHNRTHEDLFSMIAD